jgi:Domain of unknown function (DUF5655)
MPQKQTFSSEKTLDDFLNGKSPHTLALFNHFVEEYKKIGKVTLHPAKTMIGIATPRKRIAYVIQLGKDFIHVVFPFEKPHPDNLCFQKIAQVPMPIGRQAGDAKQFNHHFRMYVKEDVNKEVMKFMTMAFKEGS